MGEQGQDGQMGSPLGSSKSSNQEDNTQPEVQPVPCKDCAVSVRTCRTCSKSICVSCSVLDEDNEQNCQCRRCAKFNNDAFHACILATPEKKSNIGEEQMDMFEDLQIREESLSSSCKEPFPHQVPMEMWKELHNCNLCATSTQKCCKCFKTKCYSCLVPGADNEQNH